MLSVVPFLVAVPVKLDGAAGAGGTVTVTVFVKADDPVAFTAAIR